MLDKTESTIFSNIDSVYIIAEIGINHNGNLDVAKKLVRSAATIGAHGVKIQVRDLGAIYTDTVLADPLTAEQGTQHLLDELYKVHLSFEEVEELFDFSAQFNIDFFATPFDLVSAEFLNDIDAPIFKIGSPDFTNLPLLRKVIGFRKPIIISTGMSTETEIEEVIGYLRKYKADFSLLHCNSTYPAAYQDINLNYIPKLKKISGVKVGYSGHENGYAPTLGAIALGSEIIERHLTLDTSQDGLDHSSSLDVLTFKEMIREIRKLENSLGIDRRTRSQGEKNNFLSLGKSLVAARDLESGTILNERDLVARTPARGISPLNLPKFIGQVLERDLAKDEYMSLDDINKKAMNTGEVLDINIPKKWGIVGRLNDYQDYLNFLPELVEIHLTWRDIENFSPTNVKHNQDLVVHAPEYYRDKLIDFATNDPSVLEYSIEMLNKTIDLARELNNNFLGQKHTEGPRVVVHPGGHFMTPTISDKDEQYRLLIKNLKGVNTEGVRILVENMPPFPWYFGGQWHNTIFLSHKEIVQFCENIGWGTCYDLSHAQLYCNHADIKLTEFTKTILPHIEYMHVSDAAGVTNEGLQIGEGNVDFDQVFAILHKLDTGFIPEIWQGHLQKGKGFAEALRKIDKIYKRLSKESCFVH